MIIITLCYLFCSPHSLQIAICPILWQSYAMNSPLGVGFEYLLVSLSDNFVIWEHLFKPVDVWFLFYVRSSMRAEAFLSSISVFILLYWWCDDTRVFRCVLFLTCPLPCLEYNAEILDYHYHLTPITINIISYFRWHRNLNTPFILHIS